MTMLSVPVSADLAEQIDTLIAEGVAPNKAELTRKALRLLAEEEALQRVLAAQQEIRDGKVLRGDLRELADTI